MIEIFVDGKSILLKKGCNVADFLRKEDKASEVLAYKVNNKIVDKDYVFKDGDEVVSLTIETDEGYLIYKETLILVLIDAAERLYGAAPVSVRQSVNKSTYFEIEGVLKDREKVAKDIKNKMKEIIQKDEPPTFFVTDPESAAKLFEESNMPKRAEDVRSLPTDKVKMCRAGERYHITYQGVSYSVSALRCFDVITYEDGFLLRYPTNYSNGEIPPTVASRKIHSAIEDYRDWTETLGAADIFSLNQFIREGKATDIINLSEGLHEKRLSRIADTIKENRDLKVILIAGPSSSGKTTFANRLCLHLRINHLSPVVISLDDYYVDDTRMPRDEKGEMDFESVEAIDYALFNEHLSLLSEGKSVTLPRYDFTVRKQKVGETLKIGEGQIIIVEGIHALNELLTSRVAKKNKYKIYLSALTSLCLDEYNAFSPTDNRLLRRLVRDAAFRNTPAEETFYLWKNVRKGEQKYIFPFESEADEVFNSSLVYELAVIKEPALKLLSTVTEESVHYSRAQRLMELLSYFEPLEKDNVPPTSFLREFVGGSTILK